MSMKTPLGRVRGLGSARSGTEHFWHQRLSGAALVPLVLFGVVALLAVAGRSHADTVATLGSPVIAIPLLLLVTAGAFHMRIGFGEIIEDYVHNEGAKVVALALNTFFAIAIGAASAFAVLKIAFGA